MHATLPLAFARPPKRSSRRVCVGPEDHGKRMTLKRFARAEAAPGYYYELASGVIQATKIPDIEHHRIVRLLTKLLTSFDLANPGVIETMGGGAEAKIELWGRESERHPDISIYLSPPPKGIAQPWDRWVPDIVIEVVSSSSARRDYEEKPKDYLFAGVKEYWIIDPRDRKALVLVRHADIWIEHRLGARAKWKTSLLPGFTLDLTRVFASKPSRRK